MTEQTLFIAAAELHETLSQYVVFDCRFSLADPAAAERWFKSGHIPGAQRLDMETELAGARTGRNGRHPLPTRRAFEQRLRAAGVTRETPLVLYDDGSLAGAARAWWLLGYFGLTEVRLLAGGFGAWTRAGYKVATGPASAPVSSELCLAEPEHGRIVDLTALPKALAHGDTTLVDAREPERFHGYQEPIDPVAGRIPGAVNLPWPTLKDNGELRPAEQLRRAWAALDIDEPPVVYCGSGVTACVLALSRVAAGLTPARLYPGGFSEWSADPNRPIETDAAD